MLAKEQSFTAERLFCGVIRERGMAWRHSGNNGFIARHHEYYWLILAHSVVFGLKSAQGLRLDFLSGNETQTQKSAGQRQGGRQES